MDITKAKKPLHIVCPYCKKELQYYGASIKSRKEGQIKRLDSLMAKLSKETIPANRKILKQRYGEALFKLKLLNEDIAMLNEMSEFQVLKIFKRKIRKEINNDKLIDKIIAESEEEYLEENAYNYYDNAIQRYTDFETKLERRQ